MISEPLSERGCPAHGFDPCVPIAINGCRKETARDHRVAMSGSNTLKATAQSKLLDRRFAGHFTWSCARSLARENAVRQSGCACGPTALIQPRAKPWIAWN
jgi:hypothetical protein